MKKIMFNDRYGLTQAVLEGRKTMTRRMMTPQPSWVSADGHIYNDSKPPHFKVGEVVAVAQRYKDIRDIIGDIQDGKSIKSMAGWNNKMFVTADFMPHQIRITGVRVERLQDISDEDCIKEGIERDGEVYAFNDYEGYETPRLAFAALINRISGKGTWEFNPWVYVYDFELVK